MLNTNELTTLNTIISDENKTFESILQTFQKSFVKIEHFKVGITLIFLIKDNVINKLFKFKLLNLPQRLASLYILFEMYKNDKANTTPFISLIIEIAQESKNLTEKKFVMELSDISSKVEIKK